MRVQQSLTLTFEGEDVAHLRQILRSLQPHVTSSLPGASQPLLPFLPGEMCPEPADTSRFVQRLVRAVQGVS